MGRNVASQRVMTHHKSVGYKVLRRVANCWKASGHDTLGQIIALLSVGMRLKWSGSVKSQCFRAGDMSQHLETINLVEKRRVTIHKGNMSRCKGQDL
jgi:hypothetical protein